MLESVCPHQVPNSIWAADFDATLLKYEAGYHRVEQWEVSLGWISKGILFLFLIKEALLVFAVGIRLYFSTGAHVIDFVITAVAFGLEIGFFVSKQYGSNSQAATLTHLIVVLLVWRVVRLLHGLLETAFAVQNHDTEQHNTEQLQRSAVQLKRAVSSLEQRVRELEQAAAQAGAPRVWHHEQLVLVMRAFQQSINEGRC